MEAPASFNDIGEAGSSRNYKPMQIPEEVFEYEVFLSFRGPDTRRGFADYLYTSLKDAGVRTFRDNEELRIGEEIGPELLGAIEQSKVSIPILSKEYASSKWCLDELAHMVDCRRKGQIIMPVFYYVKPSEVRNQKEVYDKALLAHGVDKETIQRWRAALKEVGSLKGWDMENGDRHEGQLVKLIVKEVLIELKKAYLLVTEFLVGVDNNVKEILGMIGTDTDDAKIVGIYGMGGIGKTTLAKVVYNKLTEDFAYCCSLDNVGETSNPIEILNLQNRLISALSRGTLSANSVDEGIMMIEKRFSHKKALILLDDVGGKSQLIALLGRRCHFGPGSRILITTKNAAFLHEFDLKTYQVGELDLNTSLQLFSKHAFRRDYPPPERLELSREIVKIAKGLPLAIEVMGSALSLYGQRKEIWDEYLEKWKMGHIEEIQKKLMISYEALDSCEKQIFLDIACLLIGCDKTNAIYMWREIGLSPIKGLEVLQMMSLIKIEEGNKFWMHDYLRDLGREIVSQESGGNLAQKSRLWNLEEALDVLQRSETNIRLEALRLNFDQFWVDSLPLGEFAVLPKLRFLRVEGQLPQSLLIDSQSLNSGSLLPNLRWLMWHHFPCRALTMTYFSMNKLVILNFSKSEITHDWDGWRIIIKGACNLKVLNLTNCSCLTKTPDLSGLLKLERLILDDCDRLTRIDSSIGKLKKLIFFSLISCRELQSLPEELGGLPTLKELLLEGTSIREIPDWWALEKLENPNARDSLLVRTSGSINYPTSSLDLSLMDTNFIKVLPCLERLNLRGCRHINRLPYLFGKLWSLTELDLYDSGITELPDSMEGLRNLKTLIVYTGSELKGISVLPKLPVSLTSLVILSGSMVTIPDLSDLINLNLLMLFMMVRERSSLELVPDPSPWWLGRLSKLQTLALSIPHMTNLSPELGALSQLKFLLLWDCRRLQRIPQISSSVSTLYITSCNSLTTLDISNLKNLSTLGITDTPVEDLSGRELLDNNLLECKIKIETLVFIVIEKVVEAVLEDHSYRNI
ncbi:hypothetical protein ACJRO7_014658 [Eucalyptus globulus]|uniref:TIR domain-containing protein n=1 Tax=Eucalyptus globulus TaxID=34317 RepID=A0ABD3L0X5_EUCGL